MSFSKLIRVLVLVLLLVSLINIGNTVITLASETYHCGWCLGTVNSQIYPQCEQGGCCCYGCLSCWGFCWTCGCDYSDWSWYDNCPGD